MRASTKGSRQILNQSLSLAGAVLVALILGILFLSLDGFAPGDVLGAAYSGTFSSSFRFANTISRLITITLVVLAAAIPFKAGIWNIGGDGQLSIGAFMTALVGFEFAGLPPALHLPLAILAGMLGGALWAAIPAILRLRFRANEIVTTIMMNYLATVFTSYLVNYPFCAPHSSNAETVLMPANITLLTMVPLSNLTTGLFLAILAFGIIYFLDKVSVWGYEWRILGANEEFGRYGGVKDQRMRFLSMCIGGALAGLAGSILVLGVFHKFILGISGNYGMNGVLIALIASNSPILILVVATIFAFLQSSVIGMELKLGTATELSDILQSVIILVVIMRAKILSYFSKLILYRKNYAHSK